jgi:hypothetical protein
MKKIITIAIPFTAIMIITGCAINTVSFDHGYQILIDNYNGNHGIQYDPFNYRHVTSIRVVYDTVNHLPAEAGIIRDSSSAKEIPDSAGNDWWEITGFTPL